MSDTLNHSIIRAHDFEPLEVEGRLPAGLEGTLFRAGPGLLERFGQKVAHPFDADGVVTAVRLGGGVATGASRCVESDEFREEDRRGRFLYGTSAPWWRRVLNTAQGRSKSTGNTNLVSWQGRLLALMEASLPIELDANTLDTRAATNLGVIRGAFSAHPHRVHALATTFNFGMRGRNLDLFALPDRGSARQIGTVVLDRPGMVHDFVATDRHLVFVMGPAKLVTWRAVMSLGSLSDYFEWRPDEGTRIVVVPLANPEKQVSFRVGSFWVWHFVNAFEDGDRIMVDLCRHEDFAVFGAPSSAGPEHGHPKLHRYALDPVKQTFEGTCLWDAPTEFPSVHPRVVGARQRFSWLQTFPHEVHAGGVARFDHERGDAQAWRAPDGHLAVEPLFVPKAGSEGEGWVLQLVQDPTAQRSYLAVLDAEHLADGPVARVWFRQRIPMTFHGIFVASS